MVPVSISNPWPGFQGPSIFRNQICQNGARESESYNSIEY